jgi:drug/metabolite transporter (DMT)-like permease
MNTETIAVLLSEATLSLYPILIKNVHTDLATQLFFRLGTYSALSAGLADKKDIISTWGSVPSALSSIAYGFMNLIHIGSSYIGFAELPAGTAMALFYTYPFFNIIAGVLLLGEDFKMITIPFFALALVGVYLLSKEEEKKDKDEKKEGFSNKSWTLGLIAIFIAALTETLIFIVAKLVPGGSNAFYPMLQLYVGAFFLLLGALGAKAQMPDWSAAGPLVLFNTFIGFVGYAMRFYAIPLLPTAVFSILSFIGVITAYGWGNLFVGEVPSLEAFLGALLNTGSIAGVHMVS